MQSKQQSRMKYFTSQIDMIPGPQKSRLRNIQEENEAERNEEKKFGDEKFQLRNSVFYGSYYQQGDQKYVKEHQPSRAYKTYMKGMQNQWSRAQNDENGKQARTKCFYASTKLY